MLFVSQALNPAAHTAMGEFTMLSLTDLQFQRMLSPWEKLRCPPKCSN